MRILYGIQGTGNGHITRARAMQQAFARHAVRVDYLVSGREHAALFDMEAFGDFLHRPGLTFVVEQGRIRPLQTVRRLALRQFLRDVRELDTRPYDVILTDFEPVTAWAGRRSGKTVIGTGHQYAFHYGVPKAGNNPIAAAILRGFAPADIPLGFHWHHFGQPVLPPLFESRQPAAPNGSVVVYLPFEDTASVCDWLAGFPQQRFAVFAPTPIASPREHIRIHPLSRDGFQHTLAGCDGVICNTGFELISEALQLGKKILTKPLHGQMEQLSNARALVRLGLATVVPALDARALTHWLAAPPAPRRHYPDVARAVADWVVAGDWDDHPRLARQLWQQAGGHPRPAPAGSSLQAA